MRRALPWRLAARLALLPALALARPGVAAPDALHYVVEPGESLFVIGQKLLGRADGGLLLQGWNRLPRPQLLQPGEHLKVPLAALRDRLALSTVLGITGHPVGGATPGGALGQICGGLALVAGQRLPEGACIQTGERDHLALLLPDGSRLDVFPGTRLRLARAVSWARGNQRWVDVRLEQGRVQSQTQQGSGIYRIGTPMGLAAVRGTAFSVDAQPGRMVVDVAEGRVAVSADDRRASGLVHAGEGAVVAPGQGVRVLEQLPAPGTDDAREPLTVLRDAQAASALSFGAVEGATSYRFVIAQDDRKAAVVRSGVVTQPVVPLAGLAQGAYALQLRALGPEGLAGQAAQRRVRLLDVPDPPVLLQPADGAVVPTGPLTLHCQPAQVGQLAQMGQAATQYAFELARDAQFTQLVQMAQRPVCALHTTVQGGTYYWRVRALGLPEGEPARAGAFSAVGVFHAQVEAGASRLQSGEGEAAQPVSAAGQPVGQDHGVAPGTR